MNAIRFRSLRAGMPALAVAAALVLAPVTRPALAQQYVRVLINGQSMNFDQSPIVRDGRVFVPLRGVFERLGASVVYANGQVNATGRGRNVALTIGSNQAFVDGRPVRLDVAPFLAGARTMVPLRFIAESLGASVAWDDSTSTVRINGGGPTAPPQPNVRLTMNAPTGTVFNRNPQIRFQIDHRLQLGQFQVTVNGRGVTNAVRSNGQYFLVTPPWPVPFGNTRVRIRGNTVGGIPFDLSWTFFQGVR